MRVQRSKALIAGLAVLAMGVAACSGSSNGGGSSSSPTSGGSGTGSGSSSSSGNGGSQTAGTKGTGVLADCGANPNTCNSGTPTKGGTFTYTIEKTIPAWNVNSANTNTFDIVEVVEQLSPSVFLANPDFTVTLNKDLMTSATQAIVGGKQVITYKISPNAVWNDGTPINYADFKYFWDISNTDADHCPKCTPASTGGFDDIASMTSADNGKTVVMTMKTPYSDWQYMFGTLYPAHIANQHGGDTPAGRFTSFSWFDTTQPTWSGGPYIIQNFQKDTSVTMVPNPKWYGAVKPTLDKLVFRIITDQTQEIPALQNDEVQAIYPQPNGDIVQQADGLQNTSTYLGKGLNWEHLDFNEKNTVLSDVNLRTAIFDAIDRKAIIAKTIGLFVPGAAPMGNHMFVPGQPGYTDNTTSTGQGSGDVAKAKALLTSSGYTGVGSTLKNKAGKAVSIRCTFTSGNTLRQQTCQILQDQLKQLGITVTLAPTDDLGGTLEKGNFDLIIFAWVSTPFVASGAQQIWTIKGGNDYGMNNDPAMEALITKASQATSIDTRNTLLNQADVALTKDAYVLPLFQKPTFLVLNNNYVNVRDNATSVGPPQLAQAWGTKS